MSFNSCHTGVWRCFLLITSECAFSPLSWRASQGCLLPVLGYTQMFQIPPASTAVRPHYFAATCVIPGCLHPLLQFHTSASYCASSMSVDAPRHAVAQDLGNGQLCAHMGDLMELGCPVQGLSCSLGQCHTCKKCLSHCRMAAVGWQGTAAA